ncbi:hypothetical protein ABT282_34155 [Streptomyces sp. NPDC000927]|uniref:hypothetical protein n=1 Tax=Streptomyces sp. NPDC000927 TaxID=3154371 RepID=UPI0033281037
MSASEPVKLRSEYGEPYILAVPHAPITDHRLSSTDVGVYMRCRWLTDVCAPYGDLGWLIAELRMPDVETRASVRRLVELGYLSTVGAVEIESITAREAAEGVREAIEATIDDLTPVERAALARFADLVDRRRDRAGAAWDAQMDRELGLG